MWHILHTRSHPILVRLWPPSENEEVSIWMMDVAVLDSGGGGGGAQILLHTKTGIAVTSSVQVTAKGRKHDIKATNKIRNLLSDY